MTTEEKTILKENIEVAKEALRNTLQTLEASEQKISALDIVEYFLNPTVRENREKTLKNYCLNYIYENPYLLFDLELDKEIISILPNTISVKYNDDVDVLKDSFLAGKIDEIKYKQELEILKFYYFETSKQGAEIGNMLGIYKTSFKDKVKSVKIIKKVRINNKNMI